MGTQFLRNGRCMILTYDHGMEHGPQEFVDENVDPERIFDIALEGGFSGIAVHIGIAEKYYRGAYRDVPLIVKVNGSTRMPHINPTTAMTCSVERALRAGAAAIGYSIYDGSPNEPKMFEAFSKVCEHAHEYGLPVIAWMHPRGPGIKGQSNEALAYTARIGLELGADMIVVQHNGDDENLRWMTRVAGRTKIILASSPRLHDVELLNEAKTAIECGCIGIAPGRAVWRHRRPHAIAKGLGQVVFSGKSMTAGIEHVQ